MPEIAELLAAPEHTCLMASAGCGKTEEIVKAVKISNGRQLILTHTNAGVASLKARLRKYSIPPSKYSVDTIASWLLKYSAAYPKTSGLTNPKPEGGDWDLVYSTSAKLLKQPFIKDVFQATYQGVFVDEYQDCSVTQHNIIMKLAEMSPLRVLGDPLQGIFGFRPDDPLINWDKHITPNFKILPSLDKPWRWHGKNEALGEWLVMLRNDLEEGKAIDLSSVPSIKWFQWSVPNEIKICNDALKLKGSIVGIHMWPRDAHGSAKRLSGAYQSMEEMECKSLMDCAGTFDGAKGVDLALSVMGFVHNCLITHDLLDQLERILQRGAVEKLLSVEKVPEVAVAIHALVKSNNFEIIVGILDSIRNLKGVRVYRRELFTEMKSSIRAFTQGDYSSLREAAWYTRYRTRVFGRKPEPRIISRTLLIKGLEFDHTIILKADGLIDAKNFYVAATRGCQSLTILSSSPIVRFKLPV